MKIVDYDIVEIPSYSINYIEYGDPSGLTEDEI